MEPCQMLVMMLVKMLTPFPWIPWILWILWLPWLSVALSQLLYLMENAVKHKILPILITINNNIKVIILL